jgi:hypothetical protein
MSGSEPWSQAGAKPGRPATIRPVQHWVFGPHRPRAVASRSSIRSKLATSSSWTGKNEAGRTARHVPPGNLPCQAAQTLAGVHYKPALSDLSSGLRKTPRLTPLSPLPPPHPYAGSPVAPARLWQFFQSVWRLAWAKRAYHSIGSISTTAAYRSRQELAAGLWHANCI